METGVADFHVIEPKVKPDGGHSYIDVSRIPLYDEADRVVGLLVTYEDVTEKVLGKQEKAELEAQLRKAEKMEAIGTLAGGVAHDLNNILSGVVSYPQMLLLDLSEEDPFYKPLQNIRKSGERAAAVVHDLLSLARRAVENMESVDSLSTTHSGYEEIPPGDYAVIDVADSGTGINATDLGRIFEPFYTKKKMGRSGTGLGLAVVWGIVKDHRGFIDIRTQKNHGTTFSLYFPKSLV
ncbi:hypothetical protein DSCO28_24180 [Desulfosarcina ovata subsp. sediminis]|uniref:histidine kinase n=2 Tax=Desulfosarcina ovata TaxID=83564 RepID=A0A5K7ZIA6_9BACT|nr:hypothetical protein DSCO28_24180 [Desulfosarcina ovata subsp. sediminis]